MLNSRFFSLPGFIDGPRLRTAAIVAATLVLALVLGQADLPASRVLILMIGVGLLGALLFASSVEQALYSGLLFYVVSLAAGWRALWITTNLRIYAPELIIWLLCLLQAGAYIIQRTPLRFQVPRLLLILVIVFGVLATLTAFNNKVPVDQIWAQYKNFLMLIPIFGVTSWLIQDRARWQAISTVYVLTMTAIAVLGSIEFITGQSLNIFGATSVPGTLDSPNGFVRAFFSFWGHPSVSILLVLALGILLPRLSSGTQQNPLGTWLALGAVSFGVYASGHRGTWLALGASLLIYVLFDFKRRWPILLPYSLGLLIAPSSIYEALRPLLYGTKQFMDTSLDNHTALLNYGLLRIQQSPLLGFGWGSSGWIHNDFLQVGAEVGVPALLVFVAWYAKLLWDLFRLSTWQIGQDVETRFYASGLLAVLVGLLFMMGSQVILPLSPMAVGFWFFLALATRFVSLSAESAASPESA